MLSTAYEIDGDYLGKTVEELKIIAADIQAERGHKFDADAVSAVIVYARQVMAVPARRLIIDGLKWIGPPLVLLLLVYLLLFVAK